MTSKSNQISTGLDDIFEPEKATNTTKTKEELVFHRFSKGTSWGSNDSANVLTFVIPSSDSKEDEPVQNSLTFEESDRPIRRFPQHLVEIMRRAEQDHRGTRSSPPAPLCGILTINEDSIAWVAVRGQFETTLVMFSANPEKSEVAVPATHVEVEDIVSVCAVTQPSADGANHLIAIATVSGVRLYRLLVCAASIVIDVSTNIFFSIPDVAVTSIVAADTGRLFAGCIDGWVYELQYIDSISSWWRPPKIRKVSPSVNGAFPLVALSYLPAPLFIRDRAKNFFSHTFSKQWNHMPVVDMCVHSSSVVAPSKVFLWALEKKEEDDTPAPPPGGSTRAKQYKSALQIYEVHASGLQLLDTFCDHEFKKTRTGTWMSKIFPVEPWQEVQQEFNSKNGDAAVARVCVVLGNGERVFYKYEHSKKILQYGMHSLSGGQDRIDDAPCCFFNGRFVRVNRDTSSVTSVFRSSFENAIAGNESYAYIPAVSRTLRCASAAGHRMQTCVVVPVPMPAEIGRLISLQRHPPKSFDQVFPRTVHDAFWQMHSEVQDYLVMFSYGSDRCGITLVREYSLRGRIRQAFRRQDAELYRSAIEDAFLGRSVALSNLRKDVSRKDELTPIYQRSLIFATQLSLHIDCKISANTSDLKLQEAMFQKINSAVSTVIENNAWRFCVYSVLSPWYRVPLFSQAEVAPFKGNSIPTLALRDNHKHGWKYVHDYLQQIIVLSQQRGGRHVFEVESKSSFPNHTIADALYQVQEITAVLFLLSNLFRRAPPLLVATGIKRFSSGTTIPPNTVEEFLSCMGDKAHHTLLDDVLEKSNFDAHMDQELRDYLRHFCPFYFKEKQFLKAMESLVIGESALDTSFRKVKISKNTVNLQGVCDSFEHQIVKLLTDNDTVLTDGNFDWPRVRSDMKFCALLLGYSSNEYKDKVESPTFWLSDAGGMKLSSKTIDLWQRCQLQEPKTLESGDKHSYPFLFKPPVRYLCSQICRVQKKRIDDDCLKKAAGVSKSVPQIKISELYQKSLERLLHLAFDQKKTLSKTQCAAVGSKLFENAVEVALSFNDKKCTEIVCNWLDALTLNGPKNSKSGFKPSTVMRTYRDSEPFFAVMATIQYYHHVEEWIKDKIVQPKTGSVSSDAAYYCCLLLEYLHIHNRWSDFCAKTLEIVSKKEYIVGLDHKIAWLNAALNCTNGRTLQELPHKFNFVEQIQLRLKVLHLHKLAYDRISNLLTISDGNYSHVKRWAVHFRMFNARNPLFSGVAHTFEDSDHGGNYNSGPHLRDSKDDEPPCSSMLGYYDTSQGAYKNGLLAHYRDRLINGDVSYMDHAFFLKILSNSMFFDLEIMYLHAVSFSILNHQEIKKCIEKMMVQSWFNENTTSSLEHCEGPAIMPVMDDYPNTHWDDFCMRTDYDENYLDAGWRIDLKRYILPTSELHNAIESLRRRIHSFLEIAPKSQDILRIMFPPEVLVTFACNHIGPHLGCTLTGSPITGILRHYVCAIADILLGYNSPLDACLLDSLVKEKIEDLKPEERPHAFVSYNALAAFSDAIRTKGRDRCLSLRNLWDALPLICRNLPDNSRFGTVKLGFAARLACETAASKKFGMVQDGPAVDLAMQQYKVHHEHITRLHPFTPGEKWSGAASLKQIIDLSESWYDIIMRKA